MYRPIAISLVLMGGGVGYDVVHAHDERCRVAREQRRLDADQECAWHSGSSGSFGSRGGSGSGIRATHVSDASTGGEHATVRGGFGAAGFLLFGG